MVAADEVVMDLGGVVPVQIKKGAVDALIQQKGAITAANGQVIMAARAASDLMASAINHGDIVSATSLTRLQRKSHLIKKFVTSNMAIDFRLAIIESPRIFR